MPVVCFIFTRGFRDLFFVVRYAPAPESPDFSLKPTKLLQKDRRARSVSFQTQSHAAPATTKLFPRISH